MKLFFKYLFFVCISFLFILEIVTNIFNLSSHTLPLTNLNNNKLLTPSKQGVMIKGGMRDIVSNYKINPQGFNSLKDYSSIDDTKISIAIIGDSYIQGMHVNVESSIGRIIEQETDNRLEVHEYGIAGMNIVDFQLVFNQFVKDRYDHIFILATNKDIVKKNPSVMSTGNRIDDKSIIRKIYDKLSFIRYLNINHKLSIKLNDIFTHNNRSNFKKNKITIKDVNSHAFKDFDSTCVFLYEDSKLDTSLISLLNFKYLEVIHAEKPHEFYFDSHWNLNGRKNCALTIISYLNEN